MRLYEHEAKRVLRSGGLRVPRSYGLLRAPGDLDRTFPKYPAMLKAQVLVGGRGKVGGVRKVNSAAEARAALREIFALRIKGYAVESVLVEEAVESSGACYLGVTVDPATGSSVLMASAAGGVDIEDAARSRPDLLLRLELAENPGEMPARKAAEVGAFLGRDLGGGPELELRLAGAAAGLYALYQKCDCKVAEVNPLLVTARGPLCADAKMVLDDNALYRQGELLARLGIKSRRHDVAEPTARERRAAATGFPYVDLLPEDAGREPGKIYVGLVSGGAGYGIFSIDEVAGASEEYFGGRAVPVNFMDSGGGPSRAAVAEMFALLMDHPLVDLIITSRFGGISSCDTFIRGLVDCLRGRAASGGRVVPVYGRMVGTDLAAARAYLDAARRETPGELAPLSMVVGNRKIMAEVIREGLADFLAGKGAGGGRGSGRPAERERILPPGEKVSHVSPAEGMLAYLVKQVRPELAARIAAAGRIETAVIGLGRQGTRHAGLMKEFGTRVAAAVAAGRGGARVHETIPVYDSVGEMLAAHPDVAAASIWRHYSGAAEATVEVIEAGVPIVALITEGMPVRDVRRVLVAARRRGTLLLGPNTPGAIFPPERVKVGMLPDVFYPAEPEPGRFSAEGVTICSRSGAILYHMSDALASAGIAQNAVIGVGGDSAVGCPFRDLVPVVSGFPGTELVVVAGEIGGCAEEALAADIKAHPGRYPKPVVALLSGRCAPEGKTMGHAGAIVAPGADYGTIESKKAALEAAGVTVVGSQRGLVEAVREKLGGRSYFSPERYYERMRRIWEAPPPVPTWNTAITLVAPNRLAIRGRPIEKLVGRRSLLEVAGLLVAGRFPAKKKLAGLDRLARRAAAEPAPRAPLRAGDDVSKQMAAMLLADARLAAFEGSNAERTAYALGRAAAYLARIFRVKPGRARSFSALACRSFAGERARGAGRARMLEGALVACVDHGVTPPSAQAAMIAASVRAPLEVALAGGVSAITDVHGGAGARAAALFAECAALREREKLSPRAAAESVIAARIASGARIEGLGHRLHTRDPRRDALWKLAKKTGVAGPCVALSRVVEEAFKAVKGTSLPVNVDGVIGAIVADMGLDPRAAKVLFIFGRMAGLCAHYFEETSTQPPMRRIDFAQAVYRGQ